MNEKEYKNSSENLIYTDIRVLMGGKGMENIQKPSEFEPPPPIIVKPPENERNDNNDRMPELVNSNVDEVLNTPPSWLISWGTTVFFMAFMLLGAITWFVQYPDIISAPLRIISNDLPKTIITKTDGQLIKLFVKEGQNINKGDIIAYHESTADHAEVLALETSVNNLVNLSQQNRINQIQSSNIKQYYKLGELQKPFQAFQQALMASKSAASNGVFHKKQSTIGGEINTLRKLKESTISQLNIQEKDLEMAYEEAQTQQRLSDKGYVSKLDAKNAMSRYLNKKQALEQARGSIVNNELNQSQKQQEIYEIEKNVLDQKSYVVQSLNTLKSEIEAWKQRYISTATASGKVNLLNNLQENQILKAGQELVYILPENSGYYGEMKVGQYNFGKLKLKQEVIVKLNSYPFQEFGTVKGIVSYVADIPKDSSYLVKINFPLGLTTNSNKKLEFRNGMTASGDIITENLRLIEKFFYDIRKSLRR